MLWSRTRPHLARLAFLNLAYILFIFAAGAGIGLALRLWLGSDDTLVFRFARDLSRAILLVVPNVILLQYYSRAILNGQTGWAAAFRLEFPVLVNLLVFQVGAQLILGLPFILVTTFVPDPKIQLGLYFPLLIGAMWILVRVIFVPLSLIQRGADLPAAIQESFRLTAGKFWKIWSRLFVLGLLALSGLLALGVGYLVTFALAVSGYILMFAEYAGVSPDSAGSAREDGVSRSFRVALDFLDYYFPLTFPGLVLFGVSFYLLGISFGPPTNGFALWFSFLGFFALITLGLWGRMQAFRLRHLQVHWDATRPLVGRLTGMRQDFTVGGGRAPFFFRLHYALRGRMQAGLDADLPVRVEGVGVERTDASRGDTSDIEAPLWLPCCGNAHLGGRLILRDVFGLTRHRIGPEEFRDLLVLPPLFPEKTPIKFHTMFSEEASRRRQISEEEKYYMREYIPGDRLKDINWKASQRVAELITRISPHALEESKLLHVEFRNFREADRDTAEAILHLNFLKSWALSFMQSIKRDYPEFLFLVTTGQGSTMLETDDDIQRYARVLSPLEFISRHQAEDPDPDPAQEKFIFSTMYDVGLPARISSHPGTRYNIFRTVAGGGERSKTVRFFRPELGMALPAAWTLRPDRAPTLREFPPAAGGGLYVEQRLKVKLF